MSNPETTLPPCDENGLELPAHTIVTARKWLVWQHGMTVNEAVGVMARSKGHAGPTRKRQRQEAIDVADFVEYLTNAR